MAERRNSTGSRKHGPRLSLEVLEDRRVLSGGLLSSLPLLNTVSTPTSSLTAPITTSTSSTSTASAPTSSVNQPTSTSTAPTTSLLNVDLGLGLNLGTTPSTSTTSTSSGLGLGVQVNLGLGLGTTSTSTGTSSGINLGLGVSLGTTTTSGTSTSGSGSTSGLTLDLGLPSLLNVSASLGTTSTTSTGSSGGTLALGGSTGAGLTLGGSASPVLSVGGTVSGTTDPILSVGGTVTAPLPTSSILSGPALPISVTSPVVTAGSVDPLALNTASGPLVLPATASAVSAPLVAVPASTGATNGVNEGSSLTTTAVLAEDEVTYVASQELLLDGVTTGTTQAVLVSSPSFIVPQALLAAVRKTESGGAPEGLGTLKAATATNHGSSDEATDATVPAEAVLDGEGSDLVTNFQPGGPFALDQAFSGLVEQLDLLGSEVAQAMRRSPWMTWGLGCLAAAVVCEVLHRQRRRRPGMAGDLALDDDSSSIYWLPGLSDPSEK